MTEAALCGMFPKFKIFSEIKIVTSTGMNVNVFTSQSMPVLFEFDSPQNNFLFPSIFLLWDFPHLLVSFTTITPVLNNISRGADLMVEEVENPSQCRGVFPKGAPAYINHIRNRAAFAVGVTDIDSAKWVYKDKCVIVHHFYGDKLCTLGNRSLASLLELGRRIGSPAKNFVNRGSRLNYRPGKRRTRNRAFPQVAKHRPLYTFDPTPLPLWCISLQVSPAVPVSVCWLVLGIACLFCLKHQFVT